MSLSLSQIERLLDINKPRLTTAKAPQWFDGNAWQTSKPKNVGSYQGRAGSIRRSAKGRTRRMPDGKRKYIIEAGTTEVVAYKC